MEDVDYKVRTYAQLVSLQKFLFDYDFEWNGRFLFSVFQELIGIIRNVE